MPLIQKLKPIRSRDDFAPPQPLPSIDSVLSAPPRASVPVPPTSSAHPAPMLPRRRVSSNGFGSRATDSIALLTLRRDCSAKERGTAMARRKLARKRCPGKNDFFTH